jgi:hypothetical protein
MLDWFRSFLTISYGWDDQTLTKRNNNIYNTFFKLGIGYVH